MGYFVHFSAFETGSYYVCSTGWSWTLSLGNPGCPWVCGDLSALGSQMLGSQAQDTMHTTMPCWSLLICKPLLGSLQARAEKIQHLAQIFMKWPKTSNSHFLNFLLLVADLHYSPHLAASSQYPCEVWSHPYPIFKILQAPDTPTYLLQTFLPILSYLLETKRERPCPSRELFFFPSPLLTLSAEAALFVFCVYFSALFGRENLKSCSTIADMPRRTGGC